MNAPTFLQKLIPGVADAAELAVIADKLSTLDAERETHRRSAGDLVMARGRGADVKPAEISAHHQRMAEIAAERAELRTRRRALEDKLTPASPVLAELAGIQMPARATALAVKAEDLRTKRLALIHSGPDAHSGVAAFEAELRSLETSIRVARADRRDVLAPYHEAVRQALAPLVRDRAVALRDTAAAFVAALADMRDVASHWPADSPGLGSGLDALGTVSVLGAMQAHAMATKWAT